MAAAILVTLEREVGGASDAYARGKTGKALAREADKIDSAARRKRVTPPTAMLSENVAALRAEMEAQGFDPAKMRLPPEQWFAAADGLATVRGLAEYVGANLNDFKQPNPILRDLKAAEALLAAAETAGVKFHFTRGEL